MRAAEIKRKTAETDIEIKLLLDGEGKADISTGCGFFDHMLTLFAHHSRFDLTVKAVGDTEVDYHHTVEDVGIALGQALLSALGEKKGITRYGNMILPMDEALILAAVDISGRAHLSYGLDVPACKVGDFDTELCEEFFISLCRNADLTLHIKQLDGKNSHHIIEGTFKAVARALEAAVKIDPALADKVPSTKGVL